MLCTNPVSFGWMPSGLTGAAKSGFVDAAVAVGAATPSTFSSAVRERDQDHVVLILAEAGLPLAGEHADHLHRDALDEDRGADRILVLAEQVLQHGLSEQADPGRVPLVRFRQRSARDDAASSGSRGSSA